MKGGKEKMIICDNCGEDITPINDVLPTPERNIVNINGNKKCLCENCYYALGLMLCSKEHKQKAKDYKIDVMF